MCALERDEDMNMNTFLGPWNTSSTSTTTEDGMEGEVLRGVAVPGGEEGGGARAPGVWRRRVAKTVARSRRAHSATRTQTGRSAIAETHGIGEEKGGEKNNDVRKNVIC